MHVGIRDYAITHNQQRSLRGILDVRKRGSLAYPILRALSYLASFPVVRDVLARRRRVAAGCFKALEKCSKRLRARLREYFELLPQATPNSNLSLPPLIGWQKRAQATHALNSHENSLVALGVSEQRARRFHCIRHGDSVRCAASVHPAPARSSSSGLRVALSGRLALVDSSSLHRRQALRRDPTNRRLATKPRSVSRGYPPGGPISGEASETSELMLHHVSKFTHASDDERSSLVALLAFERAAFDASCVHGFNKSDRSLPAACRAQPQYPHRGRLRGMHDVSFHFGTRCVCSKNYKYGADVLWWRLDRA